MQYSKGKYTPRDSATVTKEEYYHHYWAFANEIISPEEKGMLESLVNDQNKEENNVIKNLKNMLTKLN